MTLEKGMTNKTCNRPSCSNRNPKLWEPFAQNIREPENLNLFKKEIKFYNTYFHTKMSPKLQIKSLLCFFTDLSTPITVHKAICGMHSGYPRKIYEY